MKKKYSFIFIALGVFLLILGLVFHYTNLFDKKESKESSDPTPIIIKKDYIKSHDIEKKTKVSFPLLDDLEVDKMYVDEFSKKYFNNETATFYSATIIESDKSAEEYSDYEFKMYNDMFTQENGFKVSKNDLECKYLCNKYEISINNELIQQITNIYIKTSDSDLALITYKSSIDGKENEEINKIINNITVSNDASYTIGKINGNNLEIDFTLDNNKTVILTLDSNKYEEIPDGDSTHRQTLIRNKDKNGTTVIRAYNKPDDMTINAFADRYFNADEPGSNKKDVSISNNEIYEYDLNGFNGYAFIIDEDRLLLFHGNSTIDLNDFLNIK